MKKKNIDYVKIEFDQNNFIFSFGKEKVNKRIETIGTYSFAVENVFNFLMMLGTRIGQYEKKYETDIITKKFREIIEREEKDNECTDQEKE